MCLFIFKGKQIKWNVYKTEWSVWNLLAGQLTYFCTFAGFYGGKFKGDFVQNSLFSFNDIISIAYKTAMTCICERICYVARWKGRKWENVYVTHHASEN